ncbi:MAG: cytochrome b [Reyranella sp.]|nr:MAG: cytochrome b [Reyranella sp.]
MAAGKHSQTAIGLHWITALAVLGLLGVGLWMVGLPLGLLKLKVYAWHKWIGLAVLALTVARLLWRWRHPPPSLPGSVRDWERRLAPIAHWTLFALLLAMPLSGWLMNSAAGVGLYWFGYIPIPDLVPRDPDLFAALKTVHKVLSRLLIAVVALHVGAVIYHDVLRHDGVFRRMWPTGGK